MSTQAQATTPAAKSSHHTRAQSYQLAELVRKVYAEKALSDAEFARTATTELGFPVAAGQVATAREIFDIPNSRKERAAAARDGQAKELDDLRVQVAELTLKNTELSLANIALQGQLDAVASFAAA